MLLSRTLCMVVMIACLPVLGCKRERQMPAPVAGEGAAAKPAGAVARGDCASLPSAADLRRMLREASDRGDIGGLFGGRREWGALVDREGSLCLVVASTDDPSEVWPGSLSIAEAKAFTANAFSTDDLPLSTARLYTLSQPGHSLWGIAGGVALNPECLAQPSKAEKLHGRVCGGIIPFGGGVPLYRDRRRVGGLGTSGDTSCADHEIAKRVREAAGLLPPGGSSADDITYSGADGASTFTHPLCTNTFRNGEKIGDEAPAQGY